MVAPLGSLTLTGLTPTITQGNTLAAPLGQLTLTGLVPTITQGNSLAAPLGSLTLTGLVPTFVQSVAGNVTMTAPLGIMTLTGLVPTFAQSGGSGGWDYPSGRKKKKRVIVGNKHYDVESDLDLDFLLIRELAHGKPRLVDKPVSKRAQPQTVKAPAVIRAEPLDYRNVEIAEQQSRRLQQMDVLDALQRVRRMLDEHDVEALLMTLH